MRYFTWNELSDDVKPVLRKISEQEIEQTYFPWWQEQMRKVHKEDLISMEHCIEDFCVVHWAWEVPEES